jgi:hypothetical protein
MGYNDTPTTSPMGIDLGLEYLEYLPFATYFVSCLICKCKFDITLVKLQGRNGNSTCSLRLRRNSSEAMLNQVKIYFFLLLFIFILFS